MKPTADPATPPRLVGVGGLFIDDIVRPDGRTAMGELGGGVTHALMGAAIWGERPGIVATMGRGFPAGAAALLRERFDARGLYELDLPQARGWQVFEADGTRRELYRVKDVAPFIRGPAPENLPEAFRASRGFYVLTDGDGIRRWRAAVTGILLWEPLQQIMVPANRDAFRRTLRECPVDVVSPNLAEAQAIYGALPAVELVAAMLADGARSVALRLGAAGSLVASQRGGAPESVPAVAVPRIEDETGAGNTFCGGLLWGLLEGKSLRAAAAVGTVSASFCLETTGVIDPRRVDAAEQDRRLRSVLGGDLKFAASAATMKPMTADPAFKIQLEASRNLVRIWYQGRVSAAAMAECARELESHLPAMRAGFTAVTDLSALEAMELDCVPHLARIMDLSRAHGIGTVVRVIPDRAKDIGFNILSIIHYRSKVKIITCETPAEAERALGS